MRLSRRVNWKDDVMDHQIADMLASSAELRQRSAAACARMTDRRLHRVDLEALREKLQAT